MNMGKKITDLAEGSAIPGESRYLVSMGDGTGEKQVKCHPSDYLNPSCVDYLEPIVLSDKLLVTRKDAYSANYQSHTQTDLRMALYHYPS